MFLFNSTYFFGFFVRYRLSVGWKCRGKSESRIRVEIDPDPDPYHEKEIGSGVDNKKSGSNQIELLLFFSSLSEFMDKSE